MKLGELSLQLVVIVVIGAGIKTIIGWRDAKLAEYGEKLRSRDEFLKRVRAVHVTVERARTLLEAHRSAKTYGEQLRELIRLRPEAEEIIEDLRVSQSLFAEQDAILQGLEGIVGFLQEGATEYVRNHNNVDSGWKNGEAWESLMAKHEMNWVRDFVEQGEQFTEKYENNLINSKGKMRQEVHGSHRS